MNSDIRSKKIESYGSAYETLVNGLKRFPREMWQFRPASDRRTIHEIIIHITDSEANSYIRCRRLIAEPGSTVLGYDETKWAHELEYHHQSVDAALELFRWLRHKSYMLIKTLPESVWANTVTHTQDGVIQMDDWLHTYERHIPEHLVQMQANLEDWMRQNNQVNRTTE